VSLPETIDLARADQPSLDTGTGEKCGIVFGDRETIAERRFT